MAKYLLVTRMTLETLKRMDEYLKRVGMGANRSCFVEEAVKEYLEAKDGISKED